MNFMKILRWREPSGTHHMSLLKQCNTQLHHFCNTQTHCITWKSLSMFAITVLFNQWTHVLPSSQITYMCAIQLKATPPYFAHYRLFQRDLKFKSPRRVEITNMIGVHWIMKHSMLCPLTFTKGLLNPCCSLTSRHTCMHLYFCLWQSRNA